MEGNGNQDAEGKMKSPGLLPDSLGDYGGGIHSTVDGMQTTRLIEKALKQGWPIPDEYRKPVVNRQVQIAIDPQSRPGESTRAARTLAMMDRQNKEVALRLLDKAIPDQHEIRHGVEITEVAAQIEADEDYVNYLNHRACESDTQSGAVCQISNGRDKGAVGNGSPHASTQPGANGHSNGKE